MTNNPNPRPPGVPGLIYGYNNSSARYVDLDTGRFVSRETVFDFVDQAIVTFGLEGENFIVGAIRQNVPLQVVERVLMQELKDGYINSYVPGRGGIQNMTQRDWGIVGRIIRDKYEYVRNFMADIQAGTLSEAQLIERWQLYYNNMVQGYWAGDMEANRAAGKTEMRRTLNSKVPCGECQNYAGYWDKIGNIPLPTERCACKANCLCTVEYR
jgi:hypothetical protein